MSAGLSLADVVDLDALTVDERDHLAECETIIEAGLASFVEVGEALAQVRDSRLYRSSHGTFEDYCRERWGLSSRHVNRLVEASEVVGALGPIGPIPANEGQARELAPLRDDPEAMAAAWQQANDTADAEGRNVTAADVRRAVRGDAEPPANVDPETGEKFDPPADEEPGDVNAPVEPVDDAPEPDHPGSGAPPTAPLTEEERRERDLVEGYRRSAAYVEKVVTNFAALIALADGPRREHVIAELVWTDLDAIEERIAPHLLPSIAAPIVDLIRKERAARDRVH